MQGHGEKLSRKQEAAISALLTAQTIGAAAGVVRVNERTLRNWLKMPAFQTAYRAARRQVVEQAISQLQQAANEAVATLQKNLTCGNKSVEVRAALGILGQAVQGVELIDLEERIADLERRAAQTSEKKA